MALLAVNCGSGQRRFESVPGCEWVNVDTQEKWKPDIVADGVHLSMIEDASVDIVVLHHVLEHFGCNEGTGLLAECRRILKPGGSLLVFVPNMRAIAQRWLTRQLTDQLYFTNVYGAYMGDQADRHCWGFTASSLAEFLESCGFDHLKSYDWDTTPPGADIARDWWILGMEAIR